uniref:Uncharacterized protein n=1 Tax=Caenorhabditis japonica TaxID=281687 RepID=A0A8R1I5V0_CAEJA
MNPINRWNPGWQLLANQPRAQAGGNRPLQALPPAQAPAREQPAARQVFDRNNRAVRRVVQVQVPHRRNQRQNNLHMVNSRRHRNLAQEDRGPLTRDEQERIETLARKNYQTRTAFEYDSREDQCWLNILNGLNSNTRQITDSVSHNSHKVAVPNEDNICSSLRFENQVEAIMKTREILLSLGATENDLKKALENLQVHLKTNECEYEAIESASVDLIKLVEQLTTEINGLEEILNRMDTIRL